MRQGAVLVVEDDRDLRDAIVTVLRHAGHDVETAANGREALRTLEDGCLPCLILLDLEMPIMDGWAFLEARNRDAELARVPVVLMTAGHGRVTPSGAWLSAFMSKPFDAGDLLRVVRHHGGVSTRRAQSQLRER